MDDERMGKALAAFDTWPVAALFDVMFGPTFTLLIFIAWGRMSASSIPLTALAVGVAAFVIWRPMIWLYRRGFLPRIVR